MTTVECANCGGGGTDIQFWVTVGALVIAFLALLMNFIQFREFLRRSRARARFDITIEMRDADNDGVFRAEAGKAVLIVEIGVKNIGGCAAGETLVNVLLPRSLDVIGWCGPAGEESKEPQIWSETGERLRAPHGTTEEAFYLTKVLPRVGTKPHHVVYFECYVSIPRVARSGIPVRVKVQADEIPDDIEQYVKDATLWVQKRDPA